MSRQLSAVFEKYQHARREFVQTVADQASRPENIQSLISFGVLALLHPLLLDHVSTIQQTAALALARLANSSVEIANQIVDESILPEIVAGLNSSDAYYKKNACFVIKALAQHSSNLAQQTVDVGALDPLVRCLEVGDVRVRESAAAALGAIAGHTPELAQAVFDANALQFLIVVVMEQEPSLKRVSVSTLGEIAKHTPKLAQLVIGVQAIPRIAPLLGSQDSKLKAQACKTLGCIAKHSVDCAEAVVEGEIFPNVHHCLRDKDPTVRKNAVILIREIVKHTQELAQLVVTVGGAPELVSFLKPEMGNEPLNGVLAVGFIAAYTPQLAQSFLQEGAANILINVFTDAFADVLRMTTAWAIAQIAKHSTDHAMPFIKLDALGLILNAYNEVQDDPDIQMRMKRSLKLIIERCTEIEYLRPLIDVAPEPVLKPILEQIAKLILKNTEAKKYLFNSDGLKAIMAIEADQTSKIREHIENIAAAYPPNAVRFCSPNITETLAQEACSS